jgi:hypothetical protein
MDETSRQFDAVTAKCRELFTRKLHDYGAAWRILRPESVTDQLYIKANRIRTIELTGSSRIGEDVYSEYMGLVNYGVIALIQCEKGFADQIDMAPDEALTLYDQQVALAKSLMIDKNHDYGEAWRKMHRESYTDLILMKLHRVKQIEALRGETLVSEGVEANYLDIINYAVFALIKLDEMHPAA